MDPGHTYADYLRREEESDVRHEYFDGRTFALAGGSLAHAELGARLARMLGNLLAPRGCRVYSSDLRVHVRETGLSTYPDVSVVCGRPATADHDPRALINPTLLVEVLSPSTEAYDRGEKFEHYQRLDSLQGLLLVATDRVVIELRQREDDRWTIRLFGAGASVPLEGGEALSIDEVYAGVELDPRRWPTPRA